MWDFFCYITVETREKKACPGLKQTNLCFRVGEIRSFMNGPPPVYQRIFLNGYGRDCPHYHQYRQRWPPHREITEPIVVRRNVRPYQREIRKKQRKDGNTDMALTGRPLILLKYLLHRRRSETLARPEWSGWSEGGPNAWPRIFGPFRPFKPRQETSDFRLPTAPSIFRPCQGPSGYSDRAKRLPTSDHAKHIPTVSTIQTAKGFRISHRRLQCISNNCL